MTSRWGSVFILLFVSSVSAFGAPKPIKRRVLSPRVDQTFVHADGVRVAFFDADSTLRVSRSGSVSANHKDDVVILPWVAEALREVHAAGYLIAIVSNHASVEAGHITFLDAERALQNTVRWIEDRGGFVDYFDFAESRTGPDRKPEIGMKVRLENLLVTQFGPTAKIDLTRSIMVGDSAYQKAQFGRPADQKPDGTEGTHHSNADRLFAENVGITFVDAADFFGWSRLGFAGFRNVRQVADFYESLARLLRTRSSCAEYLKRD